MRLVSSSIVATFVALTLSACVVDGDVSTGDVDMSLVGQAPSGNVYRLRNAVIQIQGPQSLTLYGETNPDQLVIHFETIVGNYNAVLQTGWYLERIANGVATPVEATLLSANPLPFSVLGAQNTTVMLRFRAGADDVDMNQGGVDIVIGVEEGPILGQSQDHPGRSCSHLLAAGASIGNGFYWIDPDGDTDTSNAARAYCDMTTDGGGWTLLAWSGNTAGTPIGVPYPGLAHCPTLDCVRGSALSPDQTQELLHRSVEFGKGQSTATTATFVALGAHEYAGKYTYGALTSLYPSYRQTPCTTEGYAGTFRSLVGPTTYDNTPVYLAQGLAFGGYDYSADTNYYLWNVGTPNAICDSSGAMPATWMGTFDAGQYGPYLPASPGAHSVWVRGDYTPPPFRSCKEIFDAAESVGSGVYTIYPDGQPLQVYCDMVTDGGGWTLTYYVDAEHFDAVYLNNYVASTLPPTGLNASSDIWNVEQTPGLPYTETVFGCTQQDNVAAYSWTYASQTPQSAFDSTTTDSLYLENFPSSSSNTTASGCIAAYKYGTSYGFAVLESGASCGTCNGMLFGMYHYPASMGAPGCNYTDSTFGNHASPYDGRQITYPICNGLQTSNGQFWIGVR